MLPTQPNSNHIVDLINQGKDNAPALIAPNRPTLSYAELRKQINRTSDQLNEIGIDGNMTVAIVLPNGPEMASAFISIAACATTAPLNPAYRQEEFEYYLNDLKTDLLVVIEDKNAPAYKAAKKLGIPIAKLNFSTDDPAGVFELTAKKLNGHAGKISLEKKDAVALVLHTSGTTSRPKIVPLTHENICTSAKNIAVSLKLKDSDRCLNVMPLFHIHGLIAAVLASLYAGSSIICSSGFNALQFFLLLREHKPSWYSAVPTMHQTILSRASRNIKIIGETPLRFIRSSSASLPSQVMKELESVFSCPVIEAYGMTEAAHQMTCNPLPPQLRKPGSVGIAAGPEVRIMDANNNLMENEKIGEIVIRGANVTNGYRNNDAANAEAYSSGWFRTGDQGIIDNEGYLRLTGRLKEIINRGGEKVSPREVDEIILDHPAVSQVVTFSIPHKRLGETVAAAIVLNDGQKISEGEIKFFVGKRLANFKVPERVLFLDEIPKGVTGKLQRIGLAKKLGLN